MCGIAGFYAAQGSKLSEKALNDATLAMHKRGPDAQKTMLWAPYSGLGHARLSIIDTSEAAHQPMQDLSGRYTIVFNGEIFNYRELKQGLISKHNLVFKSQSDTEVLLNLYILQGENCLSMLNGFFAFAIYDSQENTLFLARDRYGIKPLYVHEAMGTWYFASELKALTKLKSDFRLDYESLFQYLQFNYIPGHFSIYQNVQQLRPGTALRISGEGAKSIVYYQLPQNNPPYQGTYAHACNELVQLMRDAVHRRMIADVPLGAFLSGGIDSSVVVALAAELDKNLNTFSIGYTDEPHFDETYYAQLVAQKCKTHHTVFKLSNKDLFEQLHLLLDYCDEPFADSSALAVNYLCMKTREKASVALSGDGADELFGGYRKHEAEWHIQNPGLREKLLPYLAPLLKLMPQSRNSKLGNLSRQAQKFLKNAALPSAERYWNWASIVPESELVLFLSQHAKTAELNLRKQSLLEAFNKMNPLEATLFTDMQMVLPNDMLVKVDRQSMAHSLEVRVPFLDYRVVNFAMSLPMEFKINKLGRKQIVQDAFRPMLPPELYNRPKQGFEVPLLQWFRTELSGWLFDDLLAPDYIKSQGLFNFNCIATLRKQLYSKSPGDSAARLWALLIFQNWFRKWVK